MAYVQMPVLYCALCIVNCVSDLNYVISFWEIAKFINYGDPNYNAAWKCCDSTRVDVNILKFGRVHHVYERFNYFCTWYIRCSQEFGTVSDSIYI